MNRTLFISKDAEELFQLPSYCKNRGIALSAHSLIDFKALPFEVTQAFDVLFFSSIRSFHFYTKTKTIDPSVQLATIGRSTAQRIEKMGYSLSFIGETAGDPQRVAEAFKEWLGKRRVLIPISTQSNRSIAKVLPPNQFEEPHVYETFSKPRRIEPMDGYIFTSPSNVDSFFSENQLPPKSNIIAWGKTTEAALKKYKIESAVTLNSSTEEELIEVLEAFFD